MREPEELAELQARLNVTFGDEGLLIHALRHRSACLDEPLRSNERLEFLGDSILGMVVCDYLYAHFPENSEGDLAKAKAYLVSEPTLAEAALAWGLDRVIEMSAAEEVSGGRQRRSILSDTFEAVIAAIYLDQGIRTARRVVRQALLPWVRNLAREDYQRDFKSRLQEQIQAKRRKTPRYRIAAETGADHDKTFLAHALVGNRVIGEGSGRSKKEAEQAAAKDALTRMEEESAHA